MKEYILLIFLQHGHPHRTKQQLLPHRHIEITYGASSKYATKPEPSPLLTADGIKRVQEIVGGLFYYVHGVDNKPPVALSEIGLKQAAATESTNQDITQMLDYVATYTNDGIIYQASDIIIAAHVDAA